MDETHILKRYHYTKILQQGCSNRYAIRYEHLK